MVERPVTAGETHVVALRAEFLDGDGVGYVDDFAVLVDDAALGETVRVEITSVGSNFARGEVVGAEFGYD